MSDNLNKTKKAFTLVEIILYIGLVSIMLLVITSFFGVMIQSRLRNQAIADVNEQGVQVMQIILQTVRNATAINAPTPGNSETSLSVNVNGAGLSPSVFSLNSGAIQITEGAGSAVTLSSNRVILTSLTFTNLTRSGTPGAVRVQFTLSRVNPDGRKELSYNQTFYGSASIK